MKLAEAQIKHMVDRFLGWRLPQDFRPDAGISFTRPTYHPSVDATPSGTNLLDATQTDAMVRYMLDGIPALVNGDNVADRAWLTAGGDFESKTGTELFRLDIENHGKTAAFLLGYDVQTARLAELAGKALARKVACRHRHIDGISPDGARKQIPTGIGKPPDADVVFGAVWYRDVWGQEHVSRFLLRIAATRDIPNHGLTRLDAEGVSADYWSWG